VQNSGTYFDGTLSGFTAAFIVKFDNSGNRLWSTLLETFSAPVVATDNTGNVYLTGMATGTLFPLLNPGGTVYYQPTLGGGNDVIILKFNNSGVQLWGTFYGGTSQDMGYSLGVDNSGNLYVTGTTQSNNFPLQNAGGFYQSAMTTTSTADVFLLKFNSSCSRLWGTYFGGSRSELFLSSDNLSIDHCNNVYISFNTASRNLPILASCDGGFNKSFIDTSVSTTYYDLFIARFSGSTNLTWATYIGGDGNDFRSPVAVDKKGDLFATGEWCIATNTLSYPVVFPGGTTYTASFTGYDDIYFTKFSNNTLPAQSFSYMTICQSDTMLWPGLAPGFTSGGTFTSGPGLSIDTQTGKINPALSTAGTHTVNYVQSTCYCASSPSIVTGSATVSVLSAPFLAIAGATAICLGEKRTYTASGATNYTWSTGPFSNTIQVIPTSTSTINYLLKGKNQGSPCIATKTLTVKVSKCTGVEELGTGKEVISIYPNPNNGEFSITSGHEAELQLINETGQLIRKISLNRDNNYKYNAVGLSKGIYFITSGKKESAKYKIIVSD
jgi:hypothetical protein